VKKVTPKIKLPKKHLPYKWQETLVENQLIGGVLLVFVSGKDDKEIEEKTERIKAFCNSMI